MMRKVIKPQICCVKIVFANGSPCLSSGLMVHYYCHGLKAVIHLGLISEDGWYLREAYLQDFAVLKISNGMVYYGFSNFFWENSFLSYVQNKTFLIKLSLIIFWPNPTIICTVVAGILYLKEQMQFYLQLWWIILA